MAQVVIFDFTPVRGGPGTSVTINGANFTAPLTVMFGNAGNGNTPAIVTSATSTRITCTVPATAFTGQISIGNAASSGIFQVAPRVNDFTPAFGKTNTQVQVFGANFLGTTGVKIGTNAATFTVTGENQLSAFVPANATSGKISVTSAAGTGVSTNTFAVAGPSGLLITQFTPPSGPVGTELVIDGAGFLTVTNVFIGGTNAASAALSSDSQLHATVRAGAVTGPIILRGTSGAYTSSVPFYVTPLILGFSTNRGYAGSSLTVTGLNFTGATEVDFAGIPTAFTVQSVSNLVLTVPLSAVEGPVTIVTPAGIVTSPFVYTVLPRVDSFSPAAGPVGSTISINGSGFYSLTSVKIGTMNLTGNLLSPNLIQAVVPAGSTGGKIVVSSASGSSTSTTAFVVADVADLSLALTGGSNGVVFGDLTTFELAITNLGPSAALNSTFTANWNLGVTNLTMTPNSFTSSLSETGAVYNLGRMNVGVGYKLKLSARFLNTGRLTNSFAAQTTTLELVTTNNAAQSTLYVEPLQPALRTATASTNLILEWLAVTRKWALESGNTATGPWVALTTNQTATGEFFASYTNSLKGTNKFFRLRKVN